MIAAYLIIHTIKYDNLNPSKRQAVPVYITNEQEFLDKASRSKLSKRE
jgi:hypothetical protein